VRPGRRRGVEHLHDAVRAADAVVGSRQVGHCGARISCGTFGSNLADAGAGLDEVAGLLGHACDVMPFIATKVSPRPLLVMALLGWLVPGTMVNLSVVGWTASGWVWVARW
jgi:hypothetical protein